MKHFLLAATVISVGLHFGAYAANAQPAPTAAPAPAQSPTPAIQPMKFTFQTRQDGTRFIVASGDILDTTAKDFSDFLKQNWDAVGTKFGQRDTTVVLRSDGGSLGQGIQLGEIIRASHFDTAVWGMCASACAYAFLGGNERYVAPNSRLGFHQFVAADFKTSQEALTFAQSATGYLVRYLKAMQIDPEVLALMTDATADKINTPDQRTMIALRITTSEPVPAPAPVAAAATSAAQPKS
jgi:hypothetical protein